MKKFVKILSILAILTSCSGVYNQMAYSDPDVSTTMDKTIWLTPTNPATTSIYIQARNTSDNGEFNDVGNHIIRALQNKGYNVTTNPDIATFILQVNVLNALSEVRNNKDNAVSDALVTGGLGYALAKKRTKKSKAAAIGVAAGLATMYFDTQSKDVLYGVQTDIRVTEKGNKTPQTVVLTTTARQVNLSPSTISYKLKRNIANSVANLF